jgi:hypothetical protein
MIKNSKKISKEVKKQLRFLIEDFLEKSDEDILSKISAQPKGTKLMWDQLEPILFADTFWMDEIESGDMTDSDYEKVLMEYHGLLQPIWNQFRDAVFNFKYEILPDRAKLGEARDIIDADASISFSHFADLLKQDTALDLEKFYDINLKVSFDSGHVTFYKRSMPVLTTFLDLLQGIDINDYAKCEYCAKCIIISRAGKRFCPGCAAKKYQRDKWEADPEGMRAKERIRYQEKRKRI